MTHVQVLLFDGYDELDAVGPFEVLAAAGLRVELVAADRAAGSEVVSAHGLRALVDADLAERPDLLVVPGGRWAQRGGAGVRAEVERGLLGPAIAGRHAAGATVASVCTGAMLLAHAGLLDGRPAVTHRVALEDLRERGADVRGDERVVDDGDVLTAGGVTAGLDLALHLVARFAGAEAARQGAIRIEHEPRTALVAAA
ncbi:DJ-1/PfpI family protein [Patulibacter brassicae]|uniref:DJ-1/PfpI family protein n=1 Tax=Patulibacter brassicae TaxID=1705717 RepID=A0ABU4VND6_9ACTN|nr:DJ-1/PfpI family protein [Patulibacter brassicae]MDX8153134.1 DJ-1/PfpI family protein [Patulibacter brassicae]